MPNCKQCAISFEITTQDRAFYLKIQVPEPKFCPDCRQQRRMAFRNDYTLYSRACDLCHKNIISPYSKESAFTIFCRECWWGDSWDAAAFACEYSPQRSFFEQYAGLRLKVPRLGVRVYGTSENSEFTTNVVDNKNCYLLSNAANNENCFYGTLIFNCQDCIDCLR